MITSKVQSLPSLRVDPPISFPFMWRSEFSERVYLRTEPYNVRHSGDVCLVIGTDDPSQFVGKVVPSNTPDKEAWGLRLPAGDAVTLTNA